ncbi:DUF6764 family protein [Nocardia sp. NPDC052254]|uniref:DUF6764 family protein n=1 Tax=Nocardia sp. NPDC052254 TaxID=3155681 RepID=UPI00342A3AEC
MKILSAILCSMAAAGIISVGAGAAAATTTQCTADDNRDITIVAGNTACRAIGDESGHARSAGIDGIGYAKATTGAVALGMGASGGIGASEGIAGLPVAVGMGPDALALTSITTDPAPGRIGISFAMNGSQAQVISSQRSAVCLGSAALAWDSHTGAACVATPVGLWRRTPTS